MEGILTDFRHCEHARLPEGHAWKEFEHRENTRSTVVEIMSQGVRFEDLEALQVVAEARANGTTFAGKELEKFVVTAESFSHWKQEYSKIWQQISADVVAKTAPLELEYAQVKQQVKQLVAAIINEHASGKTSDQDQQVNQESGQNEQTNAAVGEGINGDVLKAASKLTNRLEAQVKTIFNTLEFKQDISRGLIEQWFVAGDRQVLSEPADSLLQQQFSCLQAADARLHASLQRSFADQDITVKDGKFDKEGIDDCKDGDFQRNDLRRQLAELVLNKKQQQEIRNESVAQHELREDLDAARVQRNTCAHGLMQHAFFSVGVRLSSSSHLERIIAFDRAHRIREILKKYQISQEAKLDSTPFVKKIQDHLNYDAYKGDSLTYQTMSQSKISVEFAKAGKGVSNGIDPRIDPGFDKGFAKSSGSIPNAASSFNARSSYTDAANFARYDLDTVKNICQRDAEKLATHLLGISPNKSASSAKEVRYGRKGSFVLTLQGRRAGKWQDFETGEGGNLFALVGREQGITEFKDQLKYVAEFYGIAPESHNKESHNKESYHEESYHEERYDKNAMPELLQNTQKQEAQKETAAIAEEKERQAKLEAVAGLYRQSKPIQGSIAETYLRETRGIQGTLPDDLRFIPKGTAFVYKGKQQTTKYDCMAAVGRNFDGEILSIQVTSLNPQAQRAVGRDGKKLNKLKYGIGTGSFVVVQQSQNQESQDKERVWIAEGVETALSLKEAGVKDKIVVSQGIGNIANYQGDEREIILCADNDGLESATAKTIQKAAATLEEKGFAVQIIQPEQKGQDFNDVLLKEGKSKVAEYTSAVDLPSSQTLQKKIAGVQPEISSTASQMSPNTTDIKSQDEAPQARVARDKVAEIARSIELLEQRIAASREEGDWDTFDLSHKQRREVMAKLESDPRNVEALKHNHPQVYEKVAHEVERELSLER